MPHAWELEKKELVWAPSPPPPPPLPPPPLAPPPHMSRVRSNFIWFTFDAHPEFSALAFGFLFVLLLSCVRQIMEKKRGGQHKRVATDDDEAPTRAIGAPPLRSAEEEGDYLDDGLEGERV